MSITNFNSAAGYAEAVLQWHYTATRRCTEICIDYLKITGMSSDTRMEELYSTLNLSFEEYKTQMQVAKLNYESDWLEGQNLENSLHAIKNSQNELNNSYSQSARELKAISRQLHENKIKLNV